MVVCFVKRSEVRGGCLFFVKRSEVSGGCLFC